LIVELTPQYTPHMATIQIVIDDPLLERLDCELEGKTRARSAFIRGAIEAALCQAEVERNEEEWLRSYREQPVDKKELAVWESVQAWGDDWDGEQ
jgi:hypothetical protein